MPEPDSRGWINEIGGKDRGLPVAVIVERDAHTATLCNSITSVTLDGGGHDGLDDRLHGFRECREWGANEAQLQLRDKHFNTVIDKYWPISNRLAAPNRPFRSKLPNLTVTVWPTPGLRFAGRKKGPGLRDSPGARVRSRFYGGTWRFAVNTSPPAK